MVLGQDITDENGRTIVPDGARLTPMYIKRLSKWGVSAVAIRDEDTATLRRENSPAREIIQSATQEEREYMRRVAERTQKRFQKITGNPLMEELKRLVVRHLILSGKGLIPEEE